MRIPKINLTRRQWMVAIFCLAVGIRLILAWLSYGPDHVFNGEAERIAQAIAAKGEFSDPYAVPTGPTAHCGPFYPALLSIVYFLLGTGTAAVMVRIGLLIMVNAAGCAALPTVAEALGLPLWAGAGAGLAAALIPMHRTAETFNAWDEPYAALALMGVLALFARWQALKQRRPGALVIYGALWGFLLYLAAPLASVLVGFAVWEILASRKRQSAWLEARRWLVVCLAAGLVMLPWALRNRVQLGGWIFARSIFGLEFQISNTDGAGLLGSTHSHPSYNVAEAERVRAMGEIAYNRERLHMAGSWIQTHRQEFCILTLQRFASFWLGWWGNLGTALVFTLTTFFAVFGAWFMWRDGPRQALRVFGPVWICYPLIYYIVVYSPRYRIAMWWTVLLAAAYGAGRALETICRAFARNHHGRTAVLATAGTRSQNTAAVSGRTTR
jgi:hypothetical protein